MALRPPPGVQREYQDRLPTYEALPVAGLFGLSRPLIDQAKKPPTPDPLATGGPLSPIHPYYQIIQMQLQRLMKGDPAPQTP